MAIPLSPLIEASLSVEVYKPGLILHDAWLLAGWLVALALAVWLLRAQRHQQRTQEEHGRKLNDIRRSLQIAEHALELSGERLRPSQEADIQKNLRFFTQLFACCPVPLAVSQGADGRFLEANAEFLNLCGQARETLLSQSPADLGLWPSAGPHPELPLGLDGSNTATQVELCLQTPAGPMREVLALLAPFAIDTQSYLLTALHDITERKGFMNELAKARDSAVEALRLKSEFLANISHEVRTPLNGILGMTVVLQDTQLSEDQTDYVDTLQSSTEALLTIINDILDFSRLEAGKLHFDVEDFDLRTTLDNTIEMLALRAHSKHIELVTLIDGNVPDPLRGDSGRLRQVITNLVVNALKFTEEGEVVVQVSRAGETDSSVLLLFVVRDTGIGIPKAALPYIFQAFSQVDGSSTRKGGGTGLGLSISKQLVELMGGQIGVESTPGEGSTFWFTCRLEKQSANQARGSTRTQADFSGRRVLVADHHGATRQLLLTAVGALGADGVAAATGQDALRCLRQASSEGRGFDLVVLDQDLKDLDGSNFMRKIKQEAGLKSIPVLLVVPRNQEEDTTLLRSSGATALVSRPLRQRPLSNAMARLLDAPSSHQTRLWLDRRPPRQAGMLAPTLGPLRTARILVAEDNALNQRVALALLERLGYRAQAVATGTEVLRATESVAYDIILLDCQLPEIDGFEVSREIRRREGTETTARDPRTYIIAMTALSQPGTRDRCLASGMDDFVSKPIRIEILTASLRKALEKLPPHSGSSPVVPAPIAPPPTDDEVVDLKVLGVLNHLKSDKRPDPVGEMIALFARQAPACLQDIELSLTRYEARSAEKAAHSLKGSASTMGARRLAELCAALEEEARNGHLQVAGHLLTRTRVEYLKVKETLQALRKESGIPFP